MHESNEELNFTESIAVLQGWRGRRVRVEIGPSVTSSHVAAITGVTVASIDEMPVNGRLHRDRTATVTLADVYGDMVGVLVVTEGELNGAFDFGSEAFIAIMEGVRVVVQADGRVPDDESELRWTPDQRHQAVRVLERIPWGDVRNQLGDLEEALRLMIAATGEARADWTEVAGQRGVHADEFSLAPEEIATLDTEARLALVGQLVRDAAGAVGVPLSSGAALEDSIAEIVQSLLLTASELRL